MSRLQADQRGITLMELVIVVVTIGIMAAMAVPRFMDQIPKLRTKAAVKEVVSQLRLARSAAIAEKRPIGIYFDYHEGEYIVFVDSVDVDAQSFCESDPVLKTEIFPRGIQLGYATFENSAVVFSPSGSASSSGEVMIYAHETGGLYQISILAGTGKVKMQEIK